MVGGGGGCGWLVQLIGSDKDTDAYSCGGLERKKRNWENIPMNKCLVWCFLIWCYWVTQKVKTICQKGIKKRSIDGYSDCVRFHRLSFSVTSSGWKRNYWYALKFLHYLNQIQLSRERTACNNSIPRDLPLCIAVLVVLVLTTPRQGNVHACIRLSFCAQGATTCRIL